MKSFKDLPDEQASPRFGFGELRLSRLNLWSVILLRQMHYFNIFRQYDSYFSRFFQPLLFGFAVFSLLLSSMQVALAADAQAFTQEVRWVAFVQVCRWTSIAIVVLLVFILFWLFASFLLKLLKELAYALRTLFKKQRATEPAIDDRN
jgi:hypothetical protein